MKFLVAFSLFCCLGYNLAQAQCVDTLWNHIYHSYRLTVYKACDTVTGTVADIYSEADGDTHMKLTVDTPYQYMINTANINYEWGDLVCEPICTSPVTQPDAVAACDTYAYTVFLPAVGEHVRVIGSYVNDGDHGWNEIHPVSSIKLTSQLAAPNVLSKRSPVVSVFPNPTSKFINFRLDAKPETPVYIVILDELGRLANQFQMLDMLSLKVNTTYYPAGVYNYHIEQDGRQIQGGTFVKEGN